MAEKQLVMVGTFEVVAVVVDTLEAVVEEVGT